MMLWMRVAKLWMLRRRKANGGRQDYKHHSQMQKRQLPPNTILPGRSFLIHWAGIDLADTEQALSGIMYRDFLGVLFHSAANDVSTDCTKFSIILASCGTIFIANS